MMKMTVRQRLGLFLHSQLVAMALWTSGAAFAQSTCGPYEVAYYEYGVFYFRSDAGEYTGIDKLLIEELAKRSGCILNGALDSRVRTWTRLEAGTLAITVSAIDTPERQKFADFIPYFKSRNYVALKKTIATQVSNRAEFDANPKLHLAVVKSFKHGPSVDEWVDWLRAQGRVHEYADSELVARVVFLGRHDAFLAEPGVVGPLLSRTGLGSAVTLLDWFPQDSFDAGLALSRTLVSRQDAQRLRSALQGMREDGSLDRIYRKFLNVEMSRAALR
jgi:polar amino acid transport system substrate-binding protein